MGTLEKRTVAPTPKRISDMRKIIQIATVSVNVHGHSKLIALCDDGTLWKQQPIESDVPWERITAAIPQEEE
jgi:hypothetical protein